ncbi:MAG: FecR domain-containing protein, partial [Deltaproteobacteria bacterium]|nr:FecR domain-containing protein [Deltaproteobacteria bacterium]
QPTPDTYAEFHAWVDIDPAHQDAFERLNQLWEETGVLRNNSVVGNILKKYLAKKQREKAVDQNSTRKRRWFDGFSLRFPRFKYIAVACTLLLMVGSLWMLTADRSELITYRTNTGEQKKYSFPDGSSVYLDTKTVIEGSFTEALRQVDLKEGRALFSVVHDSQRPFVVTAGRVAIQAVGTEFNVYKEKEGKISIEVTKGLVRVTPKDEAKLLVAGKIIGAQAEKPAPARNAVTRKTLALNTTKQSAPDFTGDFVTSGQKVIVDESEAVYEIKPLDFKQANTWKEGKLFFNNRPLDDIITEINRYLDNKIVFDDDQLKNRRISLNFFVSHRDEFLHSLERSFSISSRSRSDGKTVIFQTSKAIS